MTVGVWDLDVNPNAWFDPEIIPDAWFDKELISDAAAASSHLPQEIYVYLQAVNRAGTF